MIEFVAATGQEAALRGKIGMPRISARLKTTEADAIRDLKRGKKEAVDVLFRSRWSEVHRTAYLITRDAGAAEDIAQESMLTLIRSIKSFDERKPLGPWLHRIAVNRSLDWIRARDRRREVGDGPAHAQPTPEPPDTSEVIGALQELDLDQRAAVVLRHLFGYTPTEIAEMVGTSPSTVRSRLHRGLKRLREALEVSGNE